MKRRDADEARGGAGGRPMAVAAGALALALTFAATAGCDNRYLVGVGESGGRGGSSVGTLGTGGAVGPFGTGGAAVVAGTGGDRGTGATGVAGQGGSSAVVGSGGTVAACGAPAAARVPRPLALPGDEIAARLAGLIWQAPADAALLARTTAASFLNSGDVQTLAEEMLRDPRATAGMDAFARQWLELDRLATVPAPADFPALDDATRADMVEQSLRLFRWLTLETNGSFSTLLRSGTTFLDDRLASFYGVTGIPVTGWKEVDLTDAKRFGITTQLAWLTIHPRPTYRGIWIRKRLFCQDLPAPPAEVPQLLPIPEEGTFSQRLVQATSPPACTACHQLVDPMGFMYEPFDDVGRPRTDTASFVRPPRGTTETLPSGDMVFVNDLGGLMGDLARACDAQRCFVNAWFASLPAPLTADGVDGASVEAALGAFTDAGLRLSTLVAAITATPQFLSPPR